MHPLKMYYQVIDGILQKILEEEAAFNKAAEAIAKRVAEDRLIFVFGTGGHSIMGAEEVFSRAGGFACVNAMLDPGLSYLNGSRRTTLTERTVGYGKTVVDFYEIAQGDIVIIVNVNGINAVTIDSALESKRRGAEVIAVTSRSFSDNVPAGADSRHPSSKNLYEVADHVIDVHVPVGDAVLDIEGIDSKVSASSTVAIAFALNALMATVAKTLVDMGVEPPIFRSANVPGGLEYNQKFKEKYQGRVKLFM